MISSFGIIFGDVLLSVILFKRVLNSNSLNSLVIFSMLSGSYLKISSSNSIGTSVMIVTNFLHNRPIS